MTGTSEVGGLGIRISQIPSASANTPNSGIYIVSRLLPSTSVTQRLAVSNSSSKPMHVTIYPGPATNIDGVFLAQAEGTSNELTSWTTVSPSTIDLPAHSYKEVTVTINVPSAITPSESFGVIWASVSATSGGSGITSVNRVGIRMYDPIGNFSTTSSSTLSAQPSWISSHAIEIGWTSFIFIAILGFSYALALGSKNKKRAALEDSPVQTKEKKKRKKKRKKN
jgi:hypothetical protein